MLEKLKAFYSLFCAGQAVANPAAWKKGQMTGSLLASFLAAAVALAKGFGYDLHLTDEQLLQVGGTIVTVYGMFNAGVTVASTDKIGLPRQPVVAAAPAVDTESVPAVPVVDDAPAQYVPPVRRAANGDILGDEPVG
jgi:hypothetical protein